MNFGHRVLSFLFIFLKIANCFFFFLFFSSSSILQILTNFLTFHFSYTKPNYSHLISLFCIPSQFQNLSLLFSIKLSQETMAPKNSYTIFGNIFNLTHWIGATWLNDASPLLCRLNQHLSHNTRLGLVSFFKKILISSFYSNLPFLSIFWLVNAYVLWWEGFRWKPCELGWVETCLRLILIQGFTMRMHALFILAHVWSICMHTLCMCTQASSMRTHAPEYAHA